MKNLAGKPFALIGVNSDSNLAIPQELVEQGKVTWRSFQNGPDGHAISDTFEPDGWPTIFLVDAEGVVRFRNPQRGKGGIEALDQAIAELLEEMGEEFPAEKIKEDAIAEGKREFPKQTAGR